MFVRIKTTPNSPRHSVQLVEYVKAKLADERQPLLFAPEKIAEQVIRVGRQGDGKQELPVDLKQLEEEQRLITGVHEVYGGLLERPARPPCA